MTTHPIRVVSHGSVWRTALLVALCFGESSAWAASCTVTPPASPFMSFGTYQPLTFAGKLTSAHRDTVSTVSVVCTDEASYTLSLGPMGGSTIPRRMVNQDRPESPPMNFNIFTDPSRSIVWGDGMTGQALSGSTGAAGGTHHHTVYGRIPAGQNTLKPGSNYSAGPGTITLSYNP